jgi:hypothetical protein
MLFTPVTPDTKIELTDLTHSVVEGNGAFDLLMKAVSAHLEQEFQKGRIKGTEYSTVYLSAMQGVLETSLQFVLNKEKTNKELEILEVTKLKEQAQVGLIEQQTANLVLEAVNIPKQGLILDSEKLLKDQQRTNLVAEALNIPKQGLLLDAQTAKVTAEVSLLAEQILIAKEELKIAQEKLLIAKEELQIAIAKLANIPKEGLLLDEQIDKTIAETGLLNQKKISEEAQTVAGVAAAGSVLGKQIEVLTNQATGFIRDAEQKASDILIKGFSVVATTNDLTSADAATWGVSPTNVSAVITKLKQGVGA